LAKPGTKLGDSVFMNIPRVENQIKKNNLFAKQKELSEDNLYQELTIPSLFYSNTKNLIKDKEFHVGNQIDFVLNASLMNF
jgi:hypothetical protein